MCITKTAFEARFSLGTALGVRFFVFKVIEQSTLFVEFVAAELPKLLPKKKRKKEATLCTYFKCLSREFTKIMKDLSRYDTVANNAIIRLYA